MEVNRETAAVRNSSLRELDYGCLVHLGGPGT